LCVEIDTSYELYDSKFCTYTITLKYCSYCDQCDHLESCFGCIGLKREKYSILNKQYSKEDYERMMDKIKTHMINTGEWGMPIPHTLSPFAYNETAIYDMHPLTKEEALAKGHNWYEEKEEAQHFGKKYDIPVNIKDVDKDICDKILTCKVTGKNYKIIPQEFELYKRLKIPIPRISPDQRYKETLKFQPPKKLIGVTCPMCQKSTKTIYPEEMGYEVICRDCHLKKVL
jgi:hypothetical protein